MVDFNSERTVSTPPGDILKILILQHRENVIDALEEYHSMEARGGYGSEHTVLARIKSLFYEVQGMLEREYTAEEFVKLKVKVFENQDFKSALEVFSTINSLLDKKQITKVDMRRHVESDDIEAVNASHDL